MESKVCEVNKYSIFCVASFLDVDRWFLPKEHVAHCCKHVASCFEPLTKTCNYRKQRLCKGQKPGFRPVFICGKPTIIVFSHQQYALGKERTYCTVIAGQAVEYCAVYWSCQRFIPDVSLHIQQSEPQLKWGHLLYLQIEGQQALMMVNMCMYT